MHWFTKFSKDLSTNSHRFRFRSLQALHIHNSSNCCRHKCNQSISRFLKISFLFVLLFKPTVRHSLRQPASEAARRRRRSAPVVGNSLRQKHDNAQISLEKFIYYAGKKEENNFYSAFLMKLPTPNLYSRREMPSFC